jgi:hypothetical protein
VDIYQKRVPIILIIVLVGILIVQYLTNQHNTTLIDPQTCELYLKDAQIGGTKYLNEFDSKCLTIKNFDP